MADEKPIIVIKKKGGHGGHHGGAWKVAYADFVTAMMCFFLVMWLIGASDQSTKKSISTYFRRPGLFSNGSGTPLMMGESGIVPSGAQAPEYKQEKADHHQQESFQKGKTLETTVKIEGDVHELDHGKSLPYLFERPEGTPSPIPTDPVATEPDTAIPTSSNIAVTPPSAGTPTPNAPGGKSPGDGGEDQTEAKEVANQIQQVLKTSPELQELLGMVDVSVDSHGLNIEIVDTNKTSMFRSGSAQILPEAREAFLKLASIINSAPNHVDLVGHTDGKPYSSSKVGGYSNFELSSDRANAARRLLEEGGTTSDRVGSVIGKADRELKYPADPFAAANRRITLRVRFDEEKTIDLSRNPDALKGIRMPTKQPLALGEPTPATLSLTTGQILKGSKANTAPGTSPTGTKIPTRSRKDDPGAGDGIATTPVLRPYDIFGD